MADVKPLALTAEKGITLAHTPIPEADWRQTLADHPDIPADFEQCLALAIRIFRGRDPYIEHPGSGLPERLHAMAVDPSRTSVTMLLIMLEQGLENPYLTADQLAKLDGLIADTVPSLPKSVTGTNFIAHYTDSDVDPRNNIPRSIAADLVATLDAAWNMYDNNFYRTPYVAPNSPSGKIAVLVYYISDSYGFTSPSNGIALDSDSMRTQLGARLDTPYHELFHRIEYAFGLQLRFLMQPGDAWWVEGMAAWAGTWATGYVTTSARITEMFTAPETTLFDRSYFAAPIWMFLQTQQIRGNPNFFAPTTFLNGYTVNGNAKRAFAQTIIDASQGLPLDNIDYYLNCFYMNAVDKGWKSVGIGALHGGADLFPRILAYDGGTVTSGFPALSATATVTPNNPKSFTGTIPQAAARLYKYGFDGPCRGRRGFVIVTGSGAATFFLSIAFMKNDGTVVARMPPSTHGAQSVCNYQFTVASTFDFLVCAVSYEHSSAGPTGTFAIEGSVQMSSVAGDLGVDEVQSAV